MSVSSHKKAELRKRRHYRVRKRVHGTAERPRMAVFRSAAHISAQLIDDRSGQTLASAATVEADFKAAGATGNKTAAAAVGTRLAERAREAGITKVVFDRGGFLYHGRVAALADAARAAGLEF
jgi:large subunit ribosomal protein L18